MEELTEGMTDLHYDGVTHKAAKSYSNICSLSGSPAYGSYYQHALEFRSAVVSSLRPLTLLRDLEREDA